MQLSQSGGTAPNDASSNELTQAIEILLASDFTPRQILQLAGLCASVRDETGYGDVRVVYANRRLAPFKKTHSVPLVK